MRSDRRPGLAPGSSPARVGRVPHAVAIIARVPAAPKRRTHAPSTGPRWTPDRPLREGLDGPTAASVTRPPCRQADSRGCRNGSLEPRVSHDRGAARQTGIALVPVDEGERDAQVHGHPGRGVARPGGRRSGIRGSERLEQQRLGVDRPGLLVLATPAASRRMARSTPGRKRARLRPTWTSTRRAAQYVDCTPADDTDESYGFQGQYRYGYGEGTLTIGRGSADAHASGTLEIVTTHRRRLRRRLRGILGERRRRLPGPGRHRLEDHGARNLVLQDPERVQRPLVVLDDLPAPAAGTATIGGAEIAVDGAHRQGQLARPRQRLITPPRELTRASRVLDPGGPLACPLSARPCGRPPT